MSGLLTLNDMVTNHIKKQYAEGLLEKPETKVRITVDRQENPILSLVLDAPGEVSVSTIINTLNMESPFVFTVETLDKTAEGEYIRIESRAALLQLVYTFLGLPFWKDEGGSIRRRPHERID